MRYYTTGNEDFQYYVIPTQSLQSRAPGTWARPSQQFYSPIEPSQAKVSRPTRLYHQAPESVGELVGRNAPSVNQYHEFSRLWENYSAISHHDSTELQSQKIAIKAALDHENPMSNACSLYRLSLDMNNKFSKPTKYVFHEGRETSFWMHIIDTKDTCRAQYLSVEYLSQPVMDMLGTKFDIDLDFFYSSLKRIPSQRQDKVLSSGDHIRIVLPFVRMMNTHMSSNDILSNPTRPEFPLAIDFGEPSIIRMFEPDFLAIYMVRAFSGSTIISYHPASKLDGKSSAENFQKWVYQTGTDVHWPRIFNQSKDPTFVIFPILWWVIYEWTAALYRIYSHIDALGIDVLAATDVELNKRLHRLRVRLIYYRSFLDDFRKSVDFLVDTPNPCWTPLALHESTISMSTARSSLGETLKCEKGGTQMENRDAENRGTPKPRGTLGNSTGF